MIASGGTNLGWPVFEGNLCVAGQTVCADLTEAPPLITYGRAEGCAIVGGPFLPGSGAYVFGDLCSGSVWALEGSVELGWLMKEIAKSDRPIISFGSDAAGDVYVLTSRGAVMRLQTVE